MPLFFGALVVGMVTAAPAGDLTGKVTDYEKKDMAIDNVTVKLVPGDVKQGSRIEYTKNDGTYLHKNVEWGDSVHFDKVGYKHKEDVVKGLQIDECLMHEYEFYRFPAASVAKAFLGYAKGPEGKPQDFAREWDALRRFQIAPTDRIALAQQVVSQYEGALTKFPDLKQYTGASKDAVAELSGEFREAINSSGEKIPGQEVANRLKVGDQMVADIVTYELFVSAADSNRKNRFLTAFTKKWPRKSPAVWKVMKAYAPERLGILGLLTDPF
ncbi:MAG: hypothetical protein ABSF26_25530 [Thermoguttaceae bacterium]|jgi:hypothetical protein